MQDLLISIYILSELNGFNERLFVCNIFPNLNSLCVFINKKRCANVMVIDLPSTIAITVNIYFW